MIFEGGLPLGNAVEFIMQYPHANAYVVPTFGTGNNYVGTQGVEYRW
ncbi:hypothetical protein IC007_0620 [Sulfuracidifex tepidarius]|uniref:Uncharacterized protein n=1 Tax=Sulfuracidifex tepidarius TaxID=1294262 RepID=A0A510E0V0_9CREN|nr:hypothetical protein IC007_0620 [Sulfuracidifex tepidarius]